MKVVKFFFMNHHPTPCICIKLSNSSYKIIRYFYKNQNESNSFDWAKYLNYGKSLNIVLDFYI